MTMTNVTGYRFNSKLAALLGQEAEIELCDGELLHGVPMEITYPRNTAAHLMFEAAHGEYLCLDLKEISTVRECRPNSRDGLAMAAA